MPKVLVTGGAGYVGSHTAHVLLRKGTEVVVVDDLSRGYGHNVDAARLHVRPLADTDFLISLMQREHFDAVMHFAAYALVGESTEKPELYFRNNVAGTVSLLDAMSQVGLQRLVFSSTCAVYGEPSVVPLAEDLPKAPLSPYGESKAIVETMLSWMDRCRGLRSVSLRYFNACGADPEAGFGEEHDPETHLIPLLLRATMTGQPITIFGDDYPTPDGTCVRDYIHVLDLADAHIAALDWLMAGKPSGFFNVGTGGGYSVREVLAAVEKIVGKPVPFRIGPRRAGDAPVLVANPAKIQETLGWKARYTRIEDIVSMAWEFERKHGGRRNAT
jgi:UDP-glucose-4-epimerase GalE